VSTWQRYILFQIPGWIITGLIIISLWNWRYLPGWIAVLGFIGWVFKDLLMYPLLRLAYENVKPGSQALVGTRGVGGVSAALQGAPVVTIDLDLVHSREQKNVSRLVTALADLEARYRVPGLTNRTPEPSHFRPPGISFS